MRILAALLALLAGSMPLAPASAQQAEAAVVQRHVDAYRAKDMKAFLETFASDAVVIYGGMQFQGRVEIREIYRLNFAPDAPRIKIRASGGDEYIVWIQTAYVLESGQELCCGYSEYTVENGKIVMLVVSEVN